MIRFILLLNIFWAFHIIASESGLPQELKDLMPQIRQAAQKACHEAVTEATVLADLGFKEAPNSRGRQAYEIEEEVDELVATAAEKEFPLDRSAAMKEIASRFPLYKKGDTVSVTDHRGKVYSGKVKAFYGDMIKIGRSRVLYKDLIPADQSGFNVAANKAKVTAELNKLLSPILKKRSIYKAELTAEQLPKSMTAAGFVEIDGRWQPFEKVFEEKLTLAREAALPSFIASEKNKAFSGAGYTLSQDENGRDIWTRPLTEAEKLIKIHAKRRQTPHKDLKPQAPEKPFNNDF